MIDSGGCPTSGKVCGKSVGDRIKKTVGCEEPSGEDVVRNSAQDWQNIFDTLTDMITVHDADFNIVGANKAAKKILGLPFLNERGAKCFKFYHGSESPPEGCPSCGCLHTGESAFFEMYEPHLNMFMEIRVIPRLDDRGRLIGLIHIARDITKRKFAEEELDIHRHHLEQLVSLRTEELTAANERLRVEIAERRRAEEEKEELIGRLRNALANIRTLKGLLPMCAWCNKIRDEQGDWKKVDVYIKEHSDTSFTHGICPECFGKHNDMPDTLHETAE